MLYTSTHLYKILQDVFSRQLICLDVHNSNCDQQVSVNKTTQLEVSFDLTY